MMPAIAIQFPNVSFIHRTFYHCGITYYSVPRCARQVPVACSCHIQGYAYVYPPLGGASIGGRSQSTINERVESPPGMYTGKLSCDRRYRFVDSSPCLHAI